MKIIKSDNIFQQIDQVSAREEGETTFLILRQEKCSVAV
jgi:hypothetical protein